MREVIAQYHEKRLRQHALAKIFLADRTQKNFSNLLCTYTDSDYGMTDGVVTFSSEGWFDYELLTADLDSEWWIENGDFYLGGIRFIGFAPAIARMAALGSSLRAADGST